MRDCRIIRATPPHKPSLLLAAPRPAIRSELGYDDRVITLGIIAALPIHGLALADKMDPHNRLSAVVCLFLYADRDHFVGMSADLFVAPLFCNPQPFVGAKFALQHATVSSAVPRQLILPKSKRVDRQNSGHLFALASLPRTMAPLGICLSRRRRRARRASAAHQSIGVSVNQYRSNSEREKFTMARSAIQIQPSPTMRQPQRRL